MVEDPTREAYIRALGVAIRQERARRLECIKNLSWSEDETIERSPLQPEHPHTGVIWFTRKEE